MKTIAVVIGRFQPPHREHIGALLRRAAEHPHVLVLLGSSLTARTWRDPFTWQERAEFIRAATASWEGFNPSFVPVQDYPYSDARWVYAVQRHVEQHIVAQEALLGEPLVPVLVGVLKDDAAGWLRGFPQWEADLVAPEHPDVHATALREALFEGRWHEVAGVVDPAVHARVEAWLGTDVGQRLAAEYHDAARTRLVLANRNDDGSLVEAPYPPAFLTVDNVVQYKGHILLIKRRARPGRGLWALPGGFLRADEWPQDGAMRELVEETRIWFAMRGSRRRLRISPEWCVGEHMFADPRRSLRGRTLTVAYHWQIPDTFDVSVEAADDASRAQWFSVHDVLERMTGELFEDHQAIVAHFALRNR